MPTARIHVIAPDGREVTVAGRDGRVIARGRGRFDFDVVPQRIVVTAPGFRPHVIDMQPTMRWVSITQGTSLLNGPFAFESSYHYEGDAFMRMMSATRPSGIAAPMAGSTPVPATWGRSFLDPTITLGTTTQGGTSPWVVVGAVTALVGASLAVANYLQTRRSARR